MYRVESVFNDHGVYKGNTCIVHCAHRRNAILIADILNTDFGMSSNVYTECNFRELMNRLEQDNE